MTPLDWRVLGVVHGAALVGRPPWTLSELATILAVSLRTVMLSTRRLSTPIPPRKEGYSPTPASVTVGNGQRVEITKHGREVMRAAAKRPELRQAFAAWKESVLSGAVEKPGPLGPRLVPVPIAAAVLPTGGTKGGRKADAEAAALIDQARACETSVSGFVDGLREGRIKVCKVCGPRPAADFDHNRRVCQDCRRDEDKAKRPERYRR